MLTRAGAGLLSVAAALLGAGLALGNQVLLVVGAAPVLALLTPVTLGRPTVRVSRRLDPSEARVGDVVTCTLTVRVEGGPGLVEVHQAIPDAFELVDGTNLHVLAKGTGVREETLRFRFRATTRGDHDIEAVNVEVVDPAGLLTSQVREAVGPADLPVTPRPRDVPRVRGLEGQARDLVPEGDESTLGLRTTEFREIRDYTWGDPPRTVNWKATARRLSAAPPEAGALPLVDEHEREGRKAVWIFLDAGPGMRVGTDVDNALDHAVRGAASLARFFLDRGYTVGGATYRSRSDPVIRPGTGPQQVAKVHEAFRTAQPADDGDGGLAAAVERCRSTLVREDPLVVVFTRAGADPDDAVAGLRRLRGLSDPGGPDLPVLVVSPQAGALLPHRAGDPADEAARGAAGAAGRRLEREGVRRLRGFGAQVLPWDPRTHPLGDLLKQGGRA